MVAALGINAKDCKKSEDDAVVDIAVKRMIEQRNTQEETGAVHLLVLFRI